MEGVQGINKLRYTYQLNFNFMGNEINYTPLMIATMEAFAVRLEHSMVVREIEMPGYIVTRKDVVEMMAEIIAKMK